ncbi:membrane protein [Candidatus Methylomirabilis lanthanidiphila]|uniref:Membrane protein n=1 Tax=Candidatus Methylomirabilis lanthanidiphila TaxID=2211376 RepID=A0A564ZIV4_9BACT|nr:DnaJ domain-containing protein [Candidatus Methylomirabilis lanthanidiphila]VUZ84817.1 membrane protein [Candidatus Methylomirabilis lanthanidiphila]
MPGTRQNPCTWDPNDASCRQLLEALADGNPIPDISTISMDKQQLIALLVEISNGERSELFQVTRQIAESRELAAHEIASRAAFLLACLDTPGVDDPYTILGVAPTATSEEIKEAWLRRLTLYHPDRHPENGDWFTRQAARLNEAYHTLKEPERRHAYDERRRRELLARQQSTHFAIQPVSSPPAPIPTQSSHLARGRVPALIAAALTVSTGLVLMALSARSPEGQQVYLETVQPVAAVALPSSTSAAGPVRVGLHLNGSSSLNSSAIPPPDHQPERRRVRRTPQASSPLEGPAGQPDLPDNPMASERSMAHPIQLAQALPPLAPEPKALDRQEIDALLDEHVDAYERADVERVMATLSSRVREKGTMDYQAIRNAYIKGFTGRDQIIYRLKNVQVEIKAEQATVTAQYLISARHAAQPSKGITVSGRIEWKIQREGDKLKIVAINY